MSKLTLRVITPDKIALDTQAEMVQVPAVDGSMGFLPRHANLVAALDMGDLTWRENGTLKHLFVSGGFVEIKADTVRVVSEAGEKPEEIDVARAREAEKRARGRLDQGRGTGAQIDILRAELALRRAQVRLRLAGQPRV
ncbi:MAG: ATP synthase F1 subunit epsilon [Planctomycetota bacterium]